MKRLPFSEIWCVDFEYRAPEGERPAVRCMVAREALSGRLFRVWADELVAMDAPPFKIDSSALFVAFYASAEMNCFLSLGWEMPVRILDLFVERRRIVNGRGQVAPGSSLVAVLDAYGLSAIDREEKEDMRDLAMRAGDSYSQVEQDLLLEYCQSDVDALVNLLPLMLPEILSGAGGEGKLLGQALLRGRYMAAVARMEYAGVPIDTATRTKLDDNWDDIRLQLVEEVDREYDVYEGATFKVAKFVQYLQRVGIHWPKRPDGVLQLANDVFREQSKINPVIAPLHGLRSTMGRFRMTDLAVGADGRNRTMLSPFRSKTGRNQPSNSKFIFGPARWQRSLIKPPEGHAFIYCDYANQEIGIAAALSNDQGLIEGYLAGDPYLDFGKRVGFVPQDATKESHKVERQMLKGAVLGINYGMQDVTLAGRLEIDKLEARNLIRGHKEAYRTFWNWSQDYCDQVLLTNCATTEMGWKLTFDRQSQIRLLSLMNFPMQANGAEILRLACCLATEDGLEIVAPVHDALAMIAPVDELEDHKARLLHHMEAASEVVLDGFKIRAEVETAVIYPGRYAADHAGGMWDRITDLL